MIPQTNPRNLVAMAHDMVWVAGLWIGLVALRFSFEPQAMPTDSVVTSLPVVVASYLVCFHAFGLYRGIWRYASLHDLRRIGVAIAVAALVVPVVMLLWRFGRGIPRSVYLLHPIILLAAMAGGRIVYRWWTELPRLSLRHQGRPVLLLAANDNVVGLIDQFSGSPNWRVVGLLDDSAGLRGRAVSGVPVLGGWAELPRVAADLGVAHAVLAGSSLNHNVRRRVFDLCETARVKLMLMPRIDDVLSGRVQFSQIREVELDDLLGRDAVELDTEGLAHLIQNTVVLVTGAGGSIGSELCHQIARFEPSLLVLFEQSEFALYGIEQELNRRFPALSVRCIIGDVKDRVRLDEVFSRYRPQVVCHAAAYKHVPMMEQENAWAAVQNNALGTLRLTEAISNYPVSQLVFISTDKAVNPTSVMGASKRLAEMILQHWEHRSKVPTTIVRFGNVLGSTGSVIPKFKEQIMRGGPITVTHPEMRRYFMSVPEASQLVLQSALMGRGGEIFVLDMGEPVRIVDLARDLIRLSGLTEQEMRIEFTGLRPGEKLFEELLADSEATLPTRHPKVRIAKPVALPGPTWEKEVRQWLDQAEPLGEIETKATLARFVPAYVPFVDEHNVIPMIPVAARAGG